MTITRLFETGAYRVSMSNGAYEDIGYALNGDIVALIVEHHLFKSDGSGELCWERLHRKPWKSALSELLREIKHGRLRIVTTKEACAHENMRAKAATGVEPLGNHNSNIGVIIRCPDCDRVWSFDVKAADPGRRKKTKRPTPSEEEVAKIRKLINNAAHQAVSGYSTFAHTTLGDVLILLEDVVRFVHFNEEPDETSDDEVVRTLPEKEIEKMAREINDENPAAGRHLLRRLINLRGAALEEAVARIHCVAAAERVTDG